MSEQESGPQQAASALHISAMAVSVHADVQSMQEWWVCMG